MQHNDIRVEVANRYVLSVYLHWTSELQTLDSFKCYQKGRSHRLLNALALVALVQCERTLTISAQVQYLLVFIVYIVCTIWRGILIGYLCSCFFVPNALVFILACLMINLEVFVAPLMKNVFRRFYRKWWNCVCYECCYSLWKRMRNWTEFRNYLRSTWQTWNDLIAWRF